MVVVKVDERLPDPDLNHYHHHHHLCQSCVQRAYSDRDNPRYDYSFKDRDESRIGTIRSTTTLETSQALLGNERKIDESLSARPALANFVFTES